MPGFYLKKNSSLVGFSLLSRGTYHVSGTGLVAGYALLNKKDDLSEHEMNSLVWKETLNKHVIPNYGKERKQVSVRHNMRS